MVFLSAHSGRTDFRCKRHEAFPAKFSRCFDLQVRSCLPFWNEAVRCSRGLAQPLFPPGMRSVRARHALSRDTQVARAAARTATDAIQTASMLFPPARAHRSAEMVTSSHITADTMLPKQLRNCSIPRQSGGGMWNPNQGLACNMYHGTVVILGRESQLGSVSRTP
jgi:hypothetical protein